MLIQDAGDTQPLTADEKAAEIDFISKSWSFTESLMNRVQLTKEHTDHIKPVLSDINIRLSPDVSQSIVKRERAENDSDDEVQFVSQRAAAASKRRRVDVEDESSSASDEDPEPGQSSSAANASKRRPERLYCKTKDTKFNNVKIINREYIQDDGAVLFRGKRVSVNLFNAVATYLYWNDNNDWRRDNERLELLCRYAQPDHSDSSTQIYKNLYMRRRHDTVTVSLPQSRAQLKLSRRSLNSESTSRVE